MYLGGISVRNTKQHEVRKVISRRHKGMNILRRIRDLNTGSFRASENKTTVK